MLAGLWINIQHPNRPQPQLSVYGSAGNIDVLSTEGFFYLQKGKVYYSTQLIVSVRIREVGFLWIFIDRVRNKCLSALTCVCIKWIEIREIVRAFPGDIENCP